MPALHSTPDVAITTSLSRAPHLLDVLRRITVSVGTAAVVPAVLLWIVLEIANFRIAVVAVLGWMLLALFWRWATHRPVSGLLVLTFLILAVKTAITLGTGSSFVYFIQPVFGDLVVAVIFFGSLASARPAIARLAPDFYPVEAAVALLPRIRALFRRLTLMWGLVIVAKAAITLWLLTTLSTANFVLIKGGAIASLTLVAVTITVVWSVNVGRREGLLGPA